MPDFDTVITLRDRKRGTPEDRKFWARTVEQEAGEVLVEGTTISVATEVSGTWVIASQTRPAAPGEEWQPDRIIDQFGTLFVITGFAWEAAGLWRVSGQYREDD